MGEPIPFLTGSSCPPQHRAAVPSVPRLQAGTAWGGGVHGYAGETVELL